VADSACGCIDPRLAAIVSVVGSLLLELLIKANKTIIIVYRSQWVEVRLPGKLVL
jgi:hypothetical protein